MTLSPLKSLKCPKNGGRNPFFCLVNPIWAPNPLPRAMRLHERHVTTT